MCFNLDKFVSSTDKEHLILEHDNHSSTEGTVNTNSGLAHTNEGIYGDLSKI